MRTTRSIFYAGALGLCACGGDDVAADGGSSGSSSADTTGTSNSGTVTNTTVADSGSSSSTATTTASTTATTTADTSGSDTTGSSSATSNGSDSGSDSGTTGDPEGNTRGSIITECGDLVPAAEGTCDVTTPGRPEGLLLRGTVLGADEVFHGGSVLIDAAGVIQCVGCDCSGEPAAADASVVTCADGVISPGLINPHDHITYANNTPIGEGTDRYQHRHDWRVGNNNHDELPYNSGASTAVVQAAELRFVMSGATSAASAGGRGGLLRNLDTADRLEGLPVQVADSDTFPLDDADGTVHTMGCNYGPAPTTASDIAGLDGYLPHIAEGIDLAANNEFTCTSMGMTDLIERQSAVIHAVGIVPDDALEMAISNTKVIWSPRSNVVLYGNTAPVTLLDRLGVAIALGTDWVSSGSMNLQRELRCAADLNADYFDDYFSPEQLWRMVTTNAAYATGTGNAIGMLKPGYIADIAIFAAGGEVDHAAVVQAELPDTVLVLRGGVPLYGDADLVASGAFNFGTCEAFDVCGVQKRACLSELGNATIASLSNAIDDYYPLFFCGTPDLEPSCVPYRDEYAAGIAPGDADGDGIDDDNDNCPNVFNPVRLLEAVQGDADADNVGDVCDLCPLDGTDACEVPDANDFDNDGVANASDNCPYDDNPMQVDSDADGHGDVCDTCSEANPGPAPCPLPIPAIRDPMNASYPGEGAQVAITDAYVTAVRAGQGAQGFYVQDDSLDPFSGIFIYTGNDAPTVEVGNRVSVTGTYSEFFDLSEITAASVEIDDNGTDLPFEPIAFDDPSDLATGSATAEQWESMLVAVGMVSITTVNPDAPSDFDEFEVTGTLRVDDLISDNLVPGGQGNACPANTVYNGIIGIEGYSFNNYKLQPRSSDDFQVTTCSQYP